MKEGKPSKKEENKGQWLVAYKPAYNHRSPRMEERQIIENEKGERPATPKASI